MITWSIIAFVGPRHEISRIQGLDEMFDKVMLFDIPDDYGEFPDTSGYTKENWGHLESAMEDPALFGHMTKCMDAVLDWTNSRASIAAQMFYQNVENLIMWPKFGGKIFAVAGVVKAHKPNLTIGRN